MRERSQSSAELLEMKTVIDGLGDIGGIETGSSDAAGMEKVMRQQHQVQGATYLDQRQKVMVCLQ